MASGLRCCVQLHRCCLLLEREIESTRTCEIIRAFEVFSLVRRALKGGSVCLVHVGEMACGGGPRVVDRDMHLLGRRIHSAFCTPAQQTP